MRSNESLEEALKKTGLPVKYYQYEGIKQEYIVYNEEAEQLADYADDTPQEHVTWWQVHIFSPKAGDFRKYKESACKLLIDAGFTVTDMVTLYEKETKTIHVVMNCHIIEREE